MINYWYEPRENENHKTWHVEILANSDCIGHYGNWSIEQEAVARAESFIDGVKFVRDE